MSDAVRDASGPASGPAAGTAAAWDRPVRRFVALGDSFTEGLCDPAAAGAGHPWRGWADRVAGVLAARARAAGEPFEYANLAVRGRLLGQITGEQVPAALAMRPDLVSLVGGGNDALRPGVDVDAVTARLEDAVRDLRSAGARVLMATAYDPGPSPLLRRTRPQAAVFTAAVWSIARRHDAAVLDLWGMRALRDVRMWAPDRIHLTAEGHRRVALQALELITPDGDPDGDPDGGADGGGHWAVPLEALPARPRAQALRDDAAWVGRHVLPWIGRRVRGRSSGDGLEPKRPVPAPVEDRVDDAVRNAARGPAD